MQAPDLARFRNLLTERLALLEGRLNEFEHELDQPHSADDEERATEREGDEVMESLGQSGLLEIEQIKAALERFDKETFGVCAGCGEAISMQRLETIPHAARCRHCA